ncbi:MAG: hypothetical protein ACLQU4_17250 [Limisphaerales bacterium]
MLIPFGIVLGTAFFFVFCIWRRARQLCGLDTGGAIRALPAAVVQDSPSLVFGQPDRWLVVRASHPGRVQAALRLHQPTPCSWEEGLIEAREDKLFISPAISGWVVVMGAGLPGPFEDVDKCFCFLHGLSRKLGQVQFFSASRVLNQHAWVLMERGHVYRAYAWAGETLWNQGLLTAAEKELAIRCFDYGSEQDLLSLKDALAANSERVGQLAARWSLDPAAVCPGSCPGRGIVGELSQSKAH